jgi:putative ABC transport system permease protein
VVRSFVQLAAIGYVIALFLGLKASGRLPSCSRGWSSSPPGLRRAGRERAEGFCGRDGCRGGGGGGDARIAARARGGASDGAVPYPAWGMVIGNSLNAASLTMTRIRDDVKAQRPKDEGGLALGATSRQAVAPILKAACQSALIPLIDATKTTGIILLPGAMVGMIIAGADPLGAVRLQIVVLYMLFGSVSKAAILVGTLSYRFFFTPATSCAARLRAGNYSGSPRGFTDTSLTATLSGCRSA